MVLAGLGCLIAARGGAVKALAAARFVGRNMATRRFEVPPAAGHLSAAIAVAEGYADADGGKGIGLTGAVNVALAAAYRTDGMFTTDRRFRMVRPLTGHNAFRLLPDDL
ncbi:VapC toxin family PIN domain ribonuclease [Streptomyces sp. NPDC096030]|uniref:VapC toxin family PIN domain ribonuclease n=1 Tax=Streptomyces sp. NPDC096030 TaxID=3155423 RepID=UPI00332AFA09